MDVASTAAAGSASATSRSALISNYEAFLQLLTTQLRHQSPLEPLDANQFTQQLVQFSTVEQALKTNDTLTRMVEMSASAQATALVGFIGSDVVAEGARTTFADGKAVWGFDAADAGTAEITIRNSAGDIVYSTEIEVEKGAGGYVWDGETTAGTTAPEGSYTIGISAADADGKVIAVKTEIAGRVTGVDFGGDQPVLKIGDIAIPVSAIRSVSRAL